MPVRYPRAIALRTLCPRPRSPAAPPTRGGLTVDRDLRTAAVDGRPLKLTYLEFELLAHLTAHPRQVYSRKQLMVQVWRQPAVGDIRTVDVHIARLRRKIGPAHRAAIATVRQVGYLYDPARVS